MKRLGAVCEDLFLASGARVDMRKKSTRPGPVRSISKSEATPSDTKGSKMEASSGEDRPTDQLDPQADLMDCSKRTRPKGINTMPRLENGDRRGSSNLSSASRVLSINGADHEPSARQRSGSLIDHEAPTATRRRDSFQRSRERESTKKEVGSSKKGSTRTKQGHSDEIVFESDVCFDGDLGSSQTSKAASPGWRHRSASYRSDPHPSSEGRLHANPTREKGQIGPSQPTQIRHGQKRRPQSERLGKREGAHLPKSSAASRGRNMPRASSLRSEGAPRLTNLFTGRSKLVTWPMGVAPRVLFCAETCNDLDDGRGAAGLSATLLCKMGSRHRTWDVVRAGERFCLRVVGWHGGEVSGAPNLDADGRAMVYSIFEDHDAGTEGKSVVHDECSADAISGYHYVSDRRGVAGRVCGREEDCLRLTVGVWIGQNTDGKVTNMTTEVRWRVLSPHEAEENAGNQGRPGAMLLRFGYYFFLGEPCSTRLFTNTDTPEHVRLVARRASDGSIDEEVSKSLTYVVVRVSAD